MEQITTEYGFGTNYKKEKYGMIQTTEEDYLNTTKK
jgi:hypothetical protein